eukprot:TRINITY_DN76374_c0_g1_i1.p1 TRINITY_DN76374_c0_g1~~TRINITY_DN76374_c0_g1_i1.p1  ORF type:complete len:423 (+),score=106.61 TRINITY_DN76374_c0_g1_i1:55-1323(+)
MSQRRAVYAARFLRPPGWTKRLLLREKPRELTGPYENPVRRWVRLREKARLFSELPPPRRVPVPKPARKKLLQAVEGVPRVSPLALQRRLDFLLSPAAVEQQLSAPLRPGLSPYYVEYTCWERQMREIRRIYRAQYLQKLAEVTEIERAREAELHQKELEERRRRKQAHLQRIGEDMKRRAILRDRKRIEAKVNEAIEMARRSKLKRQRLYWFRRMETLSKFVVSADNLDDAFPALPGSGGSQASSAGVAGSAGSVASGVLLSRNVSIPYLLRQLGGAKADPPQKSRRIPGIDNVQREILQMSYDILGEDEERFDPVPAQGPGPKERAMQLYGRLSEEEKLALLGQKIQMLKRKQELEEEKNGTADNITTRLLDELEAVEKAVKERGASEELKASTRASRGADPEGLQPLGSARGAISEKGR